MIAGLISFHIVLCVLLVLVVLVQSGKSEGLSAAFGGAAASTFLGTSTGTFMTKLTTALVVLFMLSSLSLSIFTTRGRTSVTEGMKPADSEARPADSEARPADDEARPADDEARPADSEARPADSETGSEEG